MFIPARQPFSFHAVVYSHGWMQLAPFTYDEPAGQLTYHRPPEHRARRRVGLQRRPGGHPPGLQPAPGF